MDRIRAYVSSLHNGTTSTQEKTHEQCAQADAAKVAQNFCHPKVLLATSNLNANLQAMDAK